MGLSFLAFITACALAQTARASTPPTPPLGIPVPDEITLEDLFSTSSESGDVQGRLPGAGACDSAPQQAISLPADDAPHNDSHIEWWWWYGHLVAEDGRRFGFMVWFASKPWAHVYWADYAITDLSTGKFHYGRQPLILGRPEATRDGFVLRGDRAMATGGDGDDKLHFDVDGYELDLSLEAVKPPVIELGDGYGTAYCNSFSVYRRVRMRTVGTLKHGGRSVQITGTSDFARAWGFMPAIELANTSYFTFQLADGRDIFLFLASLRKDGDEATLVAGSISDAKGNVTTLHRGDFAITPTGYWRRDASCSYPVQYDIEVKGLHLHVRPELEQTEVRATRWPEMFALWPAWPVYWDGPMLVAGDAAGHGWLDLGHGWCHV